MDLAIEEGLDADADVVIANDPDADRCAMAVPTQDRGAGGGPAYRMLRGDEVGWLLGWWLHERGAGGPYANSIVSSSLLSKMAAAYGIEHHETLTGFKWIGRIPGLVFGYEEALGYCVDPHAVKDKDGITAALLLCELAADLAAQGLGLQDALDHLDRVFGVYATRQVSVRVTDLARIGAVMAGLRASTPTEVGGIAVSAFDDLATGSADLPPTDGLRFALVDGSRVIVRPSGTEPKVKCYLQAVVPVDEDADDGLEAARALAQERLDAIAADVRGWLDA